MRPKRLLLFLISIISVFAHAQADKQTFIVLPLVTFNGDQGLGVGGSLFWNGISDSNWTMRAGGVYSFPFQLSAFSVNLQNRKLIDWLYVSTSLSSVQSKKTLFYGYGNFSSLSGPSQYSMESLASELKVGVNIIEAVVAGIGFSNNDTSIGQGDRVIEPQYVDQYSSARFVNGSYQNFYKIFAMYDTQAPEFVPVSGTKVLVQYEQTPEDITPAAQKVLAQASHILAVSDGELWLVLRARHERVWGGDNPFYAQSRLGGKDTLRGYAINRWTDSASILYGTEGRWNFWQPGGWFERMELNLGYEVGRVYNNGAINVLMDELRPSYVIGLTGVLTQGVPVRADFAFGPEGMQFYMHLLYPF